MQQNSLSKQKITVDTLPLVAILPTQAPCDLLKINCAGAEQTIINALNVDLASRIKTIIYAATPSCEPVSGLNQHLIQLGYDVHKSRGLYIAQQI